MVDQLWLWVIGDDTVVTCCPLRWDSWLEQDERRAQTVPTSGPLRPPLYLKWLSGRVQPPQAPNLTRGMSTAMSGALGQESRRGPNRHRDPRPSVREREPDSDDWPVLNPSDPLSVSQLIDRHLRKQGRGAIKSVYEFAGLITTCCIDVFDPHQVPDEYMFLDFFERSIGRANDKAVSYLREFKEALSDLGGGVLGPDVMDITNEIELLIEVDDILDELHTLKQVLTDQKGVVSDLNKMLKEVAKDATLHPYINTRTLENHLSRIEQMRGAADKADKAASLSEAHYARESAIDTARQGKTVVVFTVVTIIFLPISFLAAIFSIDTNGFPRDEDDLIPFDYLLQHILTIGLAISIPLIVIAFNVDRISMWLNTLRDSLDSLWRRGTVVSVYASIFLAILVPIWTSSLENNVQVAVTVFIILFMGIHAVGSLFWRLIPVPMSTISATSGSDWRNRNSM
ncbi:hypothetical protein B0I35DRAFT_365304 [Stachybotrys elegans]|uniref:Ankyrin repeat protein n=1 Tax=Stachybotrys elegans TaxID=80388 RepID=A0A8K0WIJ2_9HYPO|nr:hypothetical protein B0I35DRAFT_365304 [Stachybotrys elegans]